MARIATSFPINKISPKNTHLCAMKQEKTLKQYLIETVSLAIPVVIGQLSAVFMNVTDNIMVGQLGPVYLSSTSLGNSCFILILILGFGAMNAIPSLVAEARGGEQTADLRQLYTATIWSSTIWGLGIGIAIFLSTFLLPYLGQPAQEAEFAATFMQWLSLSAPFQIVFLGLKGYFDGMERTNVGMKVSIFGLFLNMALNYIFIFILHGGLAGSAIATTLSRILMVILLLYLVRRDPIVGPLAAAAPPQPTREWMLRIFRLGLPMGLQIFFEVAAFAGAAIMIGWMSDATASRTAHQIAMNLASTTFMFALGIAVAGSVQVGEALGRKNIADMRTAGRAALLLTTAFMVLSAFVMIAFRRQFTAIYGIHDQNILTLTQELIVICAIFQVFDGAQCVGAGLLRGLQDIRIPTIMTFVAYWVLWIPLAWLLGFRLNLGVKGIWYADLFALGFAAIILNTRFFWMLNRQKTNPQNE